MKKNKRKIHFRLSLDGPIAQMVLDKIQEEKNKSKRDVFGKAKATKLLLCELFDLKRDLPTVYSWDGKKMEGF